MKIFIDNVNQYEFDFDYEEIADKVCSTVLKIEKCQYDCEINITITDNDEIREINRETREIDKETDVLSFPNLFFDAPGIFNIPEEEMACYIDPETDLIALGEIILSYDKIVSQAKEYGHSLLREYAFLIAHSMLHLSGYDHMEEDERAVMEEKQKFIMDTLDIRRD